MTKPDFEKWVAIAANGTPGLAIVRSEELLTALNGAYAAGRADACKWAENIDLIALAEECIAEERMMGEIDPHAFLHAIGSARADGRASEREECAELARRMGREPWGRCTVYSDILGDKIAKAIECMGDDE